MVHRLAGVHVGAHHEEVHGVFPVGLLVKGVQAVGNLPIAEVRPEEVPGGHQGAEAAVPGILAEPEVVPQHPPRLVGFIVAPKHRPGGHPNGPVKDDPRFHHPIDDAGGKQAPHGASFHDQTTFHGHLPFFAQVCFLSYHHRGDL